MALLHKSLEHIEKLKKDKQKKTKPLTPEEMEEKKRLEHIHRSEAQKKNMAKRRKEGYEKWLKQRRKEIAKRKKLEEKEKEKERLKKEKLREKKALEKKKRKPGRPKKRGPKKKRKSTKKVIKVIKPIKRFDYKIVSCKNGKQRGYIGQYLSLTDAYDMIDKLMEESKNIIYPIITENNGKISTPQYQYLILERNRDGSKENPIMRNEYGKLVEQRTTSNIWVIVDKFSYNVEETFWVWGYNPKTDRKTFNWIFDELIVGKIKDDYDLKRIMLYKNKVVIKNDEGEIDLILCKTVSDAIVFYNLLEEWAKKFKIKQLFFLGLYNEKSDKKSKLENELMELTGWPKSRIQLSRTKNSKN